MKTIELKRKHLNLMILAALPVSMILIAFIFDSPRNIINGLYKIIMFPDVLLIDYLVIGGLGATFLNAGILSLICVYLIFKYDVHINNSVITSVFTIAGFAFIGKNIVNVWPIFLGGYLYAKYTKTHPRDILAIVFFATTLSPAVSMTALGLGLNYWISLPLATIIGASIGFTIVPLSKHLIHSHAGYNIYNIGFVGGLIGIVIASVLRAFGLEGETQYIVSTKWNGFLRNYLIFISLFLIGVGYWKNGKSFRGYMSVFKYSGRYLSTFIEELGYGVAYINIGVMSLLSILYVILVRGNFNGPVMAAVLTAAGFATSGKNLSNTIPILFGVFIVTLLKAFEVSATNVVIAALFATTLAPIAGVYGTIPGVIAGMLHMCISPNLSYIHAGLHLYNNGFSGGIVAMVMAPLLETFLNKKEDIF